MLNVCVYAEYLFHPHKHMLTNFTANLFVSNAIVNTSIVPTMTPELSGVPKTNN